LQRAFALAEDLMRVASKSAVDHDPRLAPLISVIRNDANCVTNDARGLYGRYKSLATDYKPNRMDDPLWKCPGDLCGSAGPA